MAADVTLAPPRGVTHRGRGTALIVASSFFFGVSGALGKPAMVAGLTPPQVASMRIGLAAVLLLAGVGIFKPALLKVGRGEWRLLLGYGLLGVAGVQLFYFIAAQRLPVGIAILLEFTSPVLIALWVRFVRRTHLPRATWLGIALAMFGLSMVAQAWQGLRLDLIGLLAGLGAAVSSASYFLLGEKGMENRHPLGLVTWGMVIGAVAVCVVSPPWNIPVPVLTKEAEFGPWHPPVWLLVVALAVVSTVFAYLTGITALRHLPAATASVLGLLEPVIATATAWALLHEELTLVQIIGAVVLLGGATIVQLVAPAKKQALAEPLPPTKNDGDNS